MNKELEALERIKAHCLSYVGGSYKEITDSREQQIKDLDIIETALKDYESMKQIKIIVADKKISDEDLEKLINQRRSVGNSEQCEIKPLFDEQILKKLRALEIIKEKRVNVYYLLYYMLPENIEWGGYDNYKKDWLKKNEYCSPKNDLITIELLAQEEFDLLKEELL